jgi:hypothetical protein
MVRNNRHLREWKSLVSGNSTGHVDGAFKSLNMVLRHGVVTSEWPMVVDTLKRD